MADPKQDEPEPYSIDKARQGEIILRHKWSRIIFIAGLVLFVLAGLLVPFLGGR
ncbi:hypothetical protein [Pelagibacterium lentulum]|uniref:Peptide ABC transporter permease n=1 Tax=Pelagibacterium lentulum TaxID=2029865 RepID=A0A916VX93_9HYPH|nr:hypothetical protein [Pelagibacterium lentulum]GGA50235.1 hypothetical protein GCM10011499_20180 [Pelagibacterium lentulum]